MPHVQQQRNLALDEIEFILERRGHDMDDLSEVTRLLGFLDMLDKVELQVEIEKKFNIEISDQEVNNWHAISDVIDTYIKYQPQ